MLGSLTKARGACETGSLYSHPCPGFELWAMLQFFQLNEWRLSRTADLCRLVHSHIASRMLLLLHNAEASKWQTPGCVWRAAAQSASDGNFHPAPNLLSFRRLVRVAGALGGLVADDSAMVGSPMVHRKQLDHQRQRRRRGRTWGLLTRSASEDGQDSFRRVNERLDWHRK